MKVLIITTHMNRGGIGIYTLNLAKYLRKSGVDAEVASSGGDLEGELDAQGIPHVKLDIRTKSEFGLKVWKAVPRTAAVLKSGGFDIVHAQTRVTQVLACAAGRIAGVPAVSTCHGFFKHRRLSRRLFPCWGEKVIAISDSVRSHLVEDFRVEPGRVRRVYNGIELDRYLSCGHDKDSALMRETGLAEGAVIIGSIGRLSSVKGYVYLVEAFKELAEKAPLAQLFIVGEGPEREALEKQVTDLRLQDRVIMTPGGRKLEEYFTLMDVFCLPSVNEGLGLSLMEAMAAGRACVASDVGGISELIDDGDNGLLAPPRDPGSLAAAILRLLNDEKARRIMGEKARAKAAGNFSIQESVRGTADIYREIAGKV